MPTYDYQLTWADAANVLADVMEAENRALRARDTKTVARLQDPKNIARKQIEFAYLAGPRLEMRKAAERIDQLVLEHQRLSRRRNKFYAGIADLSASTSSYLAHLWNELQGKKPAPIQALLPPKLNHFQAVPVKIPQPTSRILDPVI